MDTLTNVAAAAFGIIPTPAAWYWWVWIGLAVCGMVVGIFSAD